MEQKCNRAIADTSTGKKPISKTRRSYIIRLCGRFIVFVLCVLICIFRPEELTILQGMNFFRRLSIFHLLWLVWVLDMVYQLFPIHKHIPLGSQKLFKTRFKPIRDKINYKALREYVISTTKAAYKVFILWAALLAVLCALYCFGIINNTVLFMISVTFYVCDLICVLVWCPFRLMMKTRCCTTCRIFNWDHLMMFTPMMFINGFFPRTLVLLSFAVWILWELCVMMYPERFWEHSNEALKCSQCTDKLCTQYCKKLRD
ncbi:MAG: hypothetical protein IJP17_01150 [Clostridia bacterium]|nr:hypothetical protein [Clostridia bacterium]